MQATPSLLDRSNHQCELCAATDTLAMVSVPPHSDESDDHNVVLCQICQQLLSGADQINADHWRCLNDSMWSPVAAVQVMAWRQLKQLQQAGETWATELLEMLYLEQEVLDWAQAGGSNQEDDAEPTLDSNGTPLQAGDNVTIIKDLVVKGANFTAKRGTTVRNISLTSNPEQIEGRVNGQRIVLLSCYLKKAN